MFPLDEGANRGETFIYIYIDSPVGNAGSRRDSSDTDTYCGKGHRGFSRSLCCWVRNVPYGSWTFSRSRTPTTIVRIIGIFGGKIRTSAFPFEDRRFVGKEMEMLKNCD